MTTRVRRADFSDSGDQAAIVEVLDAYACDPRGGGRPLSGEVRERLVPALRDHGRALALLAIDDGRPVGLAVCFVGLSTFRAQPLLNIHDLAVVEEYRGKGIGRSLLAEAERQAVALGCCKLTLEVQDDNTPARSLYERFGFRDFVVGGSAATRFLSKPLDPRPASEQ
jgi:ribosomal protein S18 acetylase RimI-like enzyme